MQVRRWYLGAVEGLVEGASSDLPNEVGASSECVYVRVYECV